MHSRDPSKPQDEFDREIKVILADSSAYHRPKYCCDFTRFVFLRSNFHGATFTQSVDFRWAIFTQRANFSDATFKREATFNFANFTEHADFCYATFCDAAFFADVRFGPRTDALTTGAKMPTIADFRAVRFLKQELVRFLRTNRNAAEGMRARFVNCHVEGVQFEAVQWHRSDGRMVLQDELNVLEKMEDAASYEEVAIAYRRLIVNFEKARAYDLAEDCTIGEFEMKRRDPSRSLFASSSGSIYERFPFLRRWIGEQLSVVGIYRLASVYGTSYRRALIALGFLLVGFGLLFSAAIDIRPMNTGAISTCTQSSTGGALCAGLIHAVEVATLQKDLLYKPVSAAGRMTEILEQVFISGQVALLLFALSRRFRR